ncbi:MAG: SDR family oxidoreductase [Candidatus Dormibacteraeota bacterium]|nr:SDR family oxidoreductase [Candidatus Dormibacteraeota bacterium]
MPKVLITGAGGYVGGRLVAALSQAGSQAHALVREPARWLTIPQTVCDLCTVAADELVAACTEMDAVVHLAGENEVVAARQPEVALGATVLASERLAAACRDAAVPRLIYLSTIHVYGERIRPGATLAEEMRPEPRSAYAISRLASEHVIAALAGESCECVIFRLTNAVGAPADPSVDRWSLVANDLARQGSLTGRLALRSSGVQWRDFVALDDVCTTIAAACDQDRLSGPSAPALASGTYNLGSGTPTTVLELAGLIQEAFARRTGSRPELAVPAPPPQRPEPYRVSVDRLAQAGLAPSGALGGAITETVDFCLANRDDL